MELHQSMGQWYFFPLGVPVPHHIMGYVWLGHTLADSCVGVALSGVPHHTLG
jgi:hypothetical protein